MRAASVLRLLSSIPSDIAADLLSGDSSKISRRALLGLSAFALSGCVTDGNSPSSLSSAGYPDTSPTVPPMYRALSDGGFQIPEVDVSQVERRYWRRDVDYTSSEDVGTLIVDTPAKYLYHVLPGQRATRYGIGVGREGFEWSGRALVAYGRAWPRWVPPDSMIQRQPELKRYSIVNGGMQPGLRNPLGARALYIHDHGRDTLYRLHGTSEPGSIGKAVSSGCIRLLNQDVIHLYNNVRNGTKIVVIPDPAMSSLTLPSSPIKS
ncbi:putative L,D-transpeptidase YnhG precursor [Afipia felis]|uniref:L,D-transpeptidase YnhG n=1 Tax=Afipia felis TaxID=1035 RepID=A0A090N7U4_AFIFE|nr:MULTISPECIES: L,D-transpeptidase [Afipia]EFI51402.1 ErfK/YbiS/YcfS/YnhG family protein [Afipia sp. 1NLS2]CEG09138.1 putative L,D-transpeptidase YnhG precursor [Afipia felis]